MRSKVKRVVVAGALGLGALGSTPTAIGAQPDSDTARALSTVMNHRATYMADSLPFDVCTIRRALGKDGEESVALLTPHVHGLMDDPSALCPRPFRSGRNVVLVDSVGFSEAAVRVFVTVLRGELIHREDYALNPQVRSLFMGVTEVRAWGHAQAYPTRRPASGATTSRR
jgi:hypothetical protein